MGKKRERAEAGYEATDDAGRRKVEKKPRPASKSASAPLVEQAAHSKKKPRRREESQSPDNTAEAEETPAANGLHIASLSQWLPRTVLSKLSEIGVNHVLPVQLTVIPLVCESRIKNQRPVIVLTKDCISYLHSKRDVCCTAPTGSGKTLAYALPIISHLVCSPNYSYSLAKRAADCCWAAPRCLVVVPTRSLTQQVAAVFRSLGLSARGQVVALGGELSLAEELHILGKDSSSLAHTSRPERRLVDVIVCTPGRLVDHLQAESVDLSCLLWLVIDEADRLLQQSYQDWLPRLLQAVNTHRRSSMGVQAPLQKLLFSATLTSNPAKLSQLQLRSPAFVSIDGSFVESAAGHGGSAQLHFPELLSEHLAICPRDEKPLVLSQLLDTVVPPKAGAIVFTSSINSTHRLALLLKLMGRKEIAEFSGTVPQAERSSVLSEFRRGTIRILVCSDAMARGMDLDDVAVVINYDPPVHIKTYLHRVGRTARAGRAGSAYTILSPEEVYHFKQMRRSTKDGKRISKIAVSQDQLEKMAEQYQSALARMKERLDQERTKQKEKQSAEN